MAKASKKAQDAVVETLSGESATAAVPAHPEPGSTPPAELEPRDLAPGETLAEAPNADQALAAAGPAIMADTALAELVTTVKHPEVLAHLVEKFDESKVEDLKHPDGEPLVGETGIPGAPSTKVLIDGDGSMKRDTPAASLAIDASGHLSLASVEGTIGITAEGVELKVGIDLRRGESASPPPDPHEKRRYRVWGWGELHRDGVVYGPGAVLEISLFEASQIGECLTLVDDDP